MKTCYSCICLPGRSALPHRECCNSQYWPQLAVPCYCSAVHFHSACICRSHKDSNHPPSSFRHSLQKMTYSMLHAELPSAICLSSSLGLCCPRNAYLRSSTRLKHHDKLYASNSDNPPHCLQILHSQPSWLHKQPQQQQSLPNSLTEWGSQKPLTSCNRPLAFAQFILFARILQQCRRTLDSDIRDLSPAQRAAVAAGCHAHLMPHTRARGTP